MGSILPTTLLAAGLLTLAPAPRQEPEARRKVPDPRLTVSWEDRTLAEVAQDLGTWLDIPFALTGAIRDRADETIRLDLKNVAASGLLRILRDQLDVRYVLSHGIVWITTPGDAVRRTAVLRIYDVRMLTTRPMPIRPPPEMGIRGQRIEEEVEVEELPPVDEEELAELLRSGTGGDESWDWPGVSLRLLNGRLIVRHTPEVHAKVLRILAALGSL